MRYLAKAVEKWYYLYMLVAITKMYGFRDWYSILVLLLVAVGIRSLDRIKWNNIDTLVLILMTYSLVSFLFSNYNLSLYYFGVKNQLVCTFMYFIARNSEFRISKFMEAFKWSMLIVIISGIILYYFPPGWYVAFRYSALLAEEGTRGYFEHTRMSSFWPHPYFLGYGSCFFIICVTKEMIIDKKFGRNNTIFLSLGLFTLFFSQMRVAIAFAILFGILIFFVMGRKLKNKVLKYFLFVIPIILSLYYVSSSLLNDDFLQYITQRSTEYEGNMVEDRFKIFSNMYKYISFFGYGLGRFGHHAVELNLPSAHDSDYLRWLCEQGVVGLFLLMSIILVTLTKGLRSIKTTFAETFILLFFPLAMIGATPTESLSQHSCMLWFCIGAIITKTQRYENCNNYFKFQQLH